MNTVFSVEDLRAVIAGWRREGLTVAFVPTMGNLHDGHISLLKEARTRADRTVVSIFVNPAQFGPQEDFSRYPRSFSHDLALLAPLGVDVVFAPTVDEMYPPGFATWIDVGDVTDRLEGAARPGHFRGVATVVAKLFAIVQPRRAYFGQKDAQQVVVVRKMVRDLALPLDIVAVPTVRDTDGVALSSRNAYLSPEERRAAAVLPRALFAAEAAFRRGESDADRLRGIVRDTVAGEPLVRLEYVSVADNDTLVELVTVDRPTLLSLAARVGSTRLIDNILLGRV